MLILLTITLLFGVNDVAVAKHGIEHSENGPVFELSQATIEAIDSGVSLTFICEFAVLTTRMFIEWPSQKQQSSFTISKHALSERYLVHMDNNIKPVIFRSSAQGMAYIAKSAQQQFRDYAQQNDNAQLRVSLDKKRLPAPIRLTAFLSSQWQFDSGWSQW